MQGATKPETKTTEDKKTYKRLMERENISNQQRGNKLSTHPALTCKKQKLRTSCQHLKF